MRHVFKAKRIGWDEEQEGVWFDSDQYTKEEAEAEFKPYQGRTQKGILTQDMNMMEQNITISLI